MPVTHTLDCLALGCCVAVTIMFAGFGNSTSSSTPRVLILASDIHAQQSKNADSLWKSDILRLLTLRQWKTLISVFMLPVIFYPFKHLIFYIFTQQFLRLTIDQSLYSSARRDFPWCCYRHIGRYHVRVFQTFRHQYFIIFIIEPLCTSNWFLCVDLVLCNITELTY